MPKHPAIKGITLLALLGAIVWLARSPDWEPAITSLLILAALVGEEMADRRASSKAMSCAQRATPDIGTIRVGQDQHIGRRLQSPSEINAAFESLAAIGSKRIQLLIQVLGPEPHLPESLADTIARRIDETTRLGVPIKYDPVLVFDSENASRAFSEGILRRTEVFSRRGVGQFVRPRYLHQRYNLGIDILIVDRTHVLFALNTVPSASTMQVGFLFKDQPEMAREFADWFDQIVMPSTQDLAS